MDSKEGQGLCPPLAKNGTPLGAASPDPHPFLCEFVAVVRDSRGCGYGGATPSGGSGTKPLTFLTAQAPPQ
jgi:hypothetical protein